MKIQIQYNPIESIPDWLLAEVGGNELIAKILLQRGMDTLEKVKAFLDPEAYTPTDPAEFPDMENAVTLIVNAVNEGKRVCVYGDYDVDGVTSTTILVNMLKSIGANVRYHVPNRFTEGYGMNPRVINRLANEVDLIVTCDCGISNNKEVALAKGLGMSVIVTDHHHLPPTMPPADAIVTPKLLPEDHPAHNIPGAGMAYFLAKAVLSRLGREEEAGAYLDLVAMAVVADVVPLTDENRYLLRKGLPVLAATQRLGLLELFNACGFKSTELTEEEIAFQIAPRLNAAGRLASAELAVNLLLTADEMEAKGLARQIDQTNTRRKEINEKMREEALGLLGKGFGGRPIILYQPHWHEGVLGITASKLCEDYNVPVLLMCLKEDGKTITGSARSISGIHIYEALNEAAPFLNKFGGHAGAAGFSLSRDKLTGFEKGTEKILMEKLEQVGGVKTVAIDGELALSAITQRLYFDLKKLAPFGEGNPVPVFLCPDAEVIYHRPTTDDKHLRLIVKHEEIQYPAIWWWSGTTEVSRTLDLIYSVGLNRWRDKEELQLIVSQAIMKEEAMLERAPEGAELVFAIDDWRNWRELGKTLPDFPGAVYFYEGLEPLELENQMNRYQSAVADYLVLLSCPPGLRVLKELLYMVQPKTLVLAYADRALQSGEVFLKNLLAIVKYMVTERSGQTNIYEISVMAGEMENTTLLGLKYLADKGLIEFEFTSPDQLLIKRGDGTARKELKVTEAKMITLLTESRAFRKYLLKADGKQLKALVSGGSYVSV